MRRCTYRKTTTVTVAPLSLGQAGLPVQIVSAGRKKCHEHEKEMTVSTESPRPLSAEELGELHTELEAAQQRVRELEADAIALRRVLFAVSELVIDAAATIDRIFPNDPEPEMQEKLREIARQVEQVSHSELGYLRAPDGTLAAVAKEEARRKQEALKQVTELEERLALANDRANEWQDIAHEFEGKVRELGQQYRESADVGTQNLHRYVIAERDRDVYIQCAEQLQTERDQALKRVTELEAENERLRETKAGN